MAIKIKRLVLKKRGANTWFFWQPSATLKAKGWTSKPLGPDRAAAIAEAERLNALVETTDLGRQPPAPASPASPARIVTVDDLIARFRRDHIPELAPNTQVTYSSGLRIIADWAGPEKLASIDPDRVAVLRDALMAPHPDTGAIRHYRAHGTLRVLRTLFEFAIRKRILPKGSNPADKFDLATPSPRFQIWQHEDEVAFDRAAAAIGYPSLGFARALTTWLGQREADMLALTAANWSEISALELEDEELHRELAADSPDGRVMGFKIRQKKGSRKNVNAQLVRRWVAVPVVGALRRQVEAAIAENARREIPTTAILVNDHNGKPWQLRRFQLKWSQAIAWAVAPPETVDSRSPVAPANGTPPHPPLAELQFRDLRRTAVVRLGQLGLSTATIVSISGHTLESAEQILEVYCPRTTPMAGRAIVARLRHDKRRAAGG